ncbi:restriction endonuclease subunit S [Silvanigrella aquatica]|uniref:Type I restriction modification DNA specificity domain-containing protein n=1 Tax=Silvanigrella aquatica TaxID=1915309 RepID=A0A1L4D401_9BACT|nr:restriction endonuclease subunit S [Silvanigrella aquatica]APJ04944.1 hypothetical protein AXG55_13980 [Silvanigrella aquatica]
MKYVKLTEVCKLLSGFAWSASKFNSNNCGVPIIRIQNVDSKNEKEFLYWDHEYNEKFVINSGDLLLTLSGSFRVVEWSGPRALLNQRIVKLIPNENKISRSWLLHSLKSKLLQIEHMGKHALVNNVSLEDLQKLALYLPPLPEQKRIADILDRADELRTKRRQAIEHLNELKQSIFLDMFGDPVENDRKWETKKISDFVLGFESGKSIVADDNEDSSSKYRVLKVSSVTKLQFAPDESKPLPPNYTPPPAHIVHNGDLLFSRANTSELIGATAYVYSTPNNLTLSDKLWRFIWYSSIKADPFYVCHLFQQPKFRFEIARRATGTSGSMKNITQDKVLSMLVGHPKINLQTKFGKLIYEIEKTRLKQINHLKLIDDLFSSLQDRAFKGELSKNDSLESILKNHAKKQNKQPESQL